MRWGVHPYPVAGFIHHGAAMGRLGRVVAFFRSPGRAAAVLALLGLIGLSAFAVVRTLQGDTRLKAAREAADRHEFDEARAQLLLRFEERGEDAEGHFQLARVERRANQYEKALRHLREAERLGAIPEAVDLERMLHRTQRGQLSPGEGMLLAYVDKEHPDSELILEALARGYVENFRLAHALDTIDRWLKLRPESVQALVLRGKLLDHKQDRDEAIRSYGRALELNPGHDIARWQMADLLIRAKNPQEALRHYEHLRGKDPDHPGMLLGLGKAYVALNRTDEAREVLDRLLARHPAYADALVQRGKVELLSLQPARAEPYLRKATEIAPFDQEGVYSLSQCLKQLGKTEEHGRCLDRLKRIDDDLTRMSALMNKIIAAPQDAAARCEAGKIFLGIGNTTEGVRWLNSALQEDPRHRETHETLARHYRAAGQADLAARHDALTNAGAPKARP
jgi:tetratricopeptide (TPR) repeat protein